MAYIWMHIFHIPRGIFGIYLVLKKSPKTHDLIESISDFSQNQLDEHWGFEQMAYHIQDNFKKHLIIILTESKMYFFIYFILSGVNTGLDLIGFLIQLIRFGSKGNEYSDLFMMA